MTETTTDCRSFDGVTVGLIDTIINCSRLLKHRDKTAPAVQEAMADLRHDEDVEALIIHADIDIRDRMRARIKELEKDSAYWEKATKMARDDLTKIKTNTDSKYPIQHTNAKIPGVVTQYDEKVFIWHTLPTKARDAEMRVANSLKRAWAHRASHLRVVKGVI